MQESKTAGRDGGVDDSRLYALQIIGYALGENFGHFGVLELSFQPAQDSLGGVDAAAGDSAADGTDCGHGAADGKADAARKAFFQNQKPMTRIGSMSAKLLRR